MASLNKIQLIGRLGQDPEIRRFEGGAVKAKFSLATSYNYSTPNGEKVEETEWHNIIMWGKLADVAEKYLKKGKQIFIEGKLKTRSWEDAESGTKKYITEVEVQNFSGLLMLGSKADTEKQNGSAF
ncbi:MAG: single-stranded DNA-binding protein [Chitinophagales bacterium]